MKQISYWGGIIVALIAVFGTWDLVKKEYLLGDVCPKIIDVPACYIVFLCFFIGLITFAFKFKYSRWIFYLFIGMLAVIALTGTFGELFGFTECPKTSGGIPMCFISLGICVSLLLLRYLHDRSHN